MSRNYRFHNPEEYVYSIVKDYAGDIGELEGVIIIK